jgi:formate hydrogenlyase subunit 4
VLGALLLGALLPLGQTSVWSNVLLAVGGQFVLAIVVGVIESTMARLRLLVVPQLLVGASVLAVVAFILISN